MIVAPGQLGPLPMPVGGWSLWHSHLAHLVELGITWRVLSMMWLLRREDLRERRDPHTQRGARR